MRADRAEKAVAAALSSVVLGEELDPVSLLHPSRFLVALGYLQKERYGVVREGWTRRYFVLTPNTLFYYRRNDEATELFGGNARELYGEARHFIPLQSIHRTQSGVLAVRQVEVVDATDSVTYFILHIRAEDRSYRFRSSSKQVVNAWQFAITSRADVFAQLSTIPEMTSIDRLLHSMLKEGALSPTVVAALGSLAGGKSLRSLTLEKSAAQVEKITGGSGASSSRISAARATTGSFSLADGSFTLNDDPSDSDDREARATTAEEEDASRLSVRGLAAASAAAAPVSSSTAPPASEHGLVAMGFLEKKKAGKNLLSRPIKVARGRAIKLTRSWGRRFFVLSETTLHWCVARRLAPALASLPLATHSASLLAADNGRQVPAVPAGRTLRSSRHRRARHRGARVCAAVRRRARQRPGHRAALCDARQSLEPGLQHPHPADAREHHRPTCSQDAPAGTSVYSSFRLFVQFFC
jgi:hypothetical protein